MSQTTTQPDAAASQPPKQIQRKVKDARQADTRGWWWGTGRRKTAVARVRLRPAKGEGTFLLRGSTKDERPVEKYFAEERDRADSLAPLRATNTVGKFDIRVKLHGGGFMGQAGAVMLGVARALVGYDPTLETALREQGMLTRDAREVERKKYGQAGARRRFQFSKR
ncbi:MAG: 30S ribosomal protein S9 [Phycisphaerales bacterium]|nr:30S ribosomal protein S9 [Phycisphaerales bacterium]